MSIWLIYYLIKTLLVLDIVVFAILSKDQLDQIFVELLLPPGPLGIRSNNPLILHIANCRLYLLVVLHEVRLASAARLRLRIVRLRVKLIELRVDTLQRGLFKFARGMIVKIILSQAYCCLATVHCTHNRGGLHKIEE